MDLGYTIVSPELVAERHYFLELLQSPYYIWGIRLLLVLSLIVALVIYKRMKGKNGE